MCSLFSSPSARNNPIRKRESRLNGPIKFGGLELSHFQPVAAASQWLRMHRKYRRSPVIWRIIAGRPVLGPAVRAVMFVWRQTCRRSCSCSDRTRPKPIVRSRSIARRPPHCSASFRRPPYRSREEIVNALAGRLASICSANRSTRSC